MATAEIKAAPEDRPTRTRTDWRPFVFEASPEVDETLKELARREGRSVEQVLAQAIALYRFLSDQHREGMHIGVTSREDGLDLEIHWSSEPPEIQATPLRREADEAAHRRAREMVVLRATLVAAGASFVAAALVLALSPSPNAQSWAMTTIGMILSALFGRWTGMQDRPSR